MASSARKVTIEFLGDDKSASRTARSVDSNTSKLGATFAKVGKMAAIGLGAGVVVAGAALVKFTQGAIEDEAAQKKLATTLKNTTGATDEQVGAVEDWISAQGRNLGVTDDELRPALSRLATATKDVGEAQKLTSLAMDVSAGTGKSLESVTTALMKAQNGSVTGLSKLGIATKNAAGETLTMDQVTKQMADTFKGQAQKQADTTAGKMQRLKVIFSEAGESIGAKMIPIVTKLADVFISDVIPALSKASAWIQTNVMPTVREMAAVFMVKMREIVKTIHDNWGEIRATFKNAIEIVRIIWDRFGENLTNILKNNFRMIIGVIKAGFTVVKGIFKVFHGLLTGDWREMWSGLKDIFRGVWNGIMAIFRGMLGNMKEVLRAAGAALRDIMRGIWDGLKELVRSGASRVVDGIRAIPSMIMKTAGLYFRAGKFLINALLDGIKGASGFISGMAGNIWDAVKSMINNGIDSLNNALSFHIAIPGAPDVDVNPPDIPHLLANGTRNFRGGLALVGERGPELVNLPRGTNVFSNARTRQLASSPVGGGGDIVVNVYGALDPNAVAKQVQAMLLKLKRTNGGQTLGIA